MKKISFLSILTLSILLFSSSYVFKDQNGRANVTGSPGETTCAACHNGGSAAASSVSVYASPSFSNNAYFPDTVYTVTVAVSATGFNRFGFGAEVLTDANVNSGVLSNPGTGAKIISSTRRNVTHSTPKIVTNNTALFTFKWTAPPAGTGAAHFYVCGNAVNGNNAFSGDLPIPYQYTLSEATVPTGTIDISGVREDQNAPLTSLHVFPNPSNGLVQIDYVLSGNAKVNIMVTSLSGQVLKTISQEQQFTGSNSYILNAKELPKGIYFLRLTTNGISAGSKLLTLY